MAFPGSCDFRSLRFADWPAADHAAWVSAIRPRDVLDPNGPVRVWRPRTVATNRARYARWLGWLAIDGRLDSAVSPADRITPEAVTAYGRRLVAGVAPKTALAHLVGLKVVAMRLAPERDWRWLAALSNRVRVWSQPSIDRSTALRPLTEIHVAALDDLARLRSLPALSRSDLFSVRDVTIVLVLSACPLRLANLACIRIGSHLRRDGERWTLTFKENETKTGERIRHTLAQGVGSWIDRYLAEIRPRCPGSAASDALWISARGRPLSPHGVYTAVCDTTARILGVAMNPHLFRTVAATTMVETAPADARLAAPLLGHRDIATTEQHYIKTSGVLESRRINAILARIRSAST